MKKKPLAPRLPGRFGRMTWEQLDSVSDQYDAEFSAARAKRIANTKPHPRKRGRPPKVMTLAGEILENQMRRRS